MLLMDKSFLFIILVIDPLCLVVRIRKNHSQLSIVLTDLQLQPQQSLEIGNRDIELHLLLANIDPSFQSFVDVSVEEVVLVVVVHIEDLRKIDSISIKQYCLLNW